VQRVEQTPVEGVLGGIVSQPPVEEIAEDVERRRRPRLLGEEAQEPLRDAGARGREMQVRDEERRVHARTFLPIRRPPRAR
jgi:hypothetical protein